MTVSEIKEIEERRKIKREVKFEKKQNQTAVKAESNSRSPPPRLENKNPQDFDNFVNEQALDVDEDDYNGIGLNTEKDISSVKERSKKKHKSQKVKQKNSECQQNVNEQQQQSQKQLPSSSHYKKHHQQDSYFQNGNDYDYDYDDDAYYEEEQKKKQSFAKKFLDLDAEVDDNDGGQSDDEYLDEGLNQVEQAQQLEQQLYRSDYRKQDAKIQKQVQRSNYDLKKVAQNYNQRVKNIQRQDSKDPLLKQSRLPKISDAKLWLIKLKKPGIQKQIAISILNKAIAMAQSSIGKRLSILSACAIDNLPGYIYVEAFKESHVREALQGNSLVMHGKGYKMAPIYQMVDVFKSGKSAILNLKPGDWVRIRSGMYSNDLAKVEMIEKGLQSVMIRLIPRLESIVEAAGSEGRDLNTKEREQVKIMRNQRIRPNQHHFMPMSEQEDLQQQTPLNSVLYKQNPDDGLYYLYWNRMMFREGFIFKKISIKSLIIDNIVASQKETDMFEHKIKNAFDKYHNLMENDDEEDNDEADKANGDEIGDQLLEGHQNPRKKQIDDMNEKMRRNKILRQSFKVGDVIEIIQQALNGLEGQILALGVDKATIKPSIQQIPVLQIPYDSLSKIFNQGDYVEVIGGGRSDLIGVTGMITTLWEDYTISVYSSHLKKEIKVKANELSKYTGKSQLSLIKMSSIQNDYNKFDLVQLIDSKIFGVILKFNDLNITIVTNSNDLKTIPISNIAHKIQTQKSTGMDSRNNALTTNDKVNVMQGDYKSYNGSILHIKSNFAFIRIMDLIKDRTMGIRCENLRNLKMIGTGEFVDVSKDWLKYKNKSLVSGPLTKRRDPLIGKRVIVIEGQWKLQQGIVLEANQQGYSLELASRNKKITVEKENVKQITKSQEEQGVKLQNLSGSGAKGGSSYKYQTGGKTPIMQGGTPAYGFNTPNSPGWGGFTPGNYAAAADYSPLKSPGHKR